MNIHPELAIDRGARVVLSLRNCRAKLRRARFQEAVFFYLFAAPWIVGFFAWTVGPMIISLVISFTRYQVIIPAEFIGLANYRSMLMHDPRVWQALKVTATYALGAVPLGVVTSLAVAMLMNQKIRGIYVFRTIYYLPAVVSGVPVALMWMWMFNPQFGILNSALAVVGIQGPKWICSTQWVIPSFIIMSLWTVGGPMVIYLAALQGIPQHLYEVCELDGGGPWVKFWNITVPMLSPVIFFNLVTGIIAAFQVFTSAYIMTSGGPANASLFYVLYLFQNAFMYFKMGYASALAWFLFVIIVALTTLVFRSSALWIYYGGELRG